MSEELTKAAQQALEALQANFTHYGDPLRCSKDAIAALRRALTQRPAAQAGEREAFEAEMRCEETWGHRSLKKRPDGRYQNWQVDVMWDVWQARASLPTQPAQAAQVPEGFALVRVDPTEEETTAVEHAMWDKPFVKGTDVWSAVLTAAQQGAEQAKGGAS